MADSIAFEVSQFGLNESIAGLGPGEEVILTQDQRPVAKLIITGTVERGRKLGTMRGSVKYMASDFDAPLVDFRECAE
jgi:antitoxin (DNA-binding transcriptional repressor) of toxin-antitoxin stability system